jgi:chromosome segregation ATPase
MVIDTIVPVLMAALGGLSAIGLVWWQEGKKGEASDRAEQRGIYGEQITYLRSDAADSRLRIQSLESEKIAMRVSLDDALRSVANIVTLNTTIQDKLNTTQKSLEDALEVIKALKSELTEFQEKFADSLKEIKSLKEEIAVLSKPHG